jgi:hypothetical protein
MSFNVSKVSGSDFTQDPVIVSNTHEQNLTSSDHENLVYQAMDLNPEGSINDIYNAIIKDKPGLKDSQSFNENYRVYYHRKKPFDYPKAEEAGRSHTRLPAPRMLHDTSGRCAT